jgi:hypothetical protein
MSSSKSSKKQLKKPSKGLYAEVIPGQKTLGNYLVDIASEVKGGKILSPTLKVLGPLGTAIGAYDVVESYKEGKPLLETAGAFLGIDPIIESIREEYRSTPETKKIKKRIRTEELTSGEHTPGLDILPPVDTSKPVTEIEKQKIATEEKKIKKQLEEEKLATKKEREKILDYVKERFSPIAEEDRIEMKEGGFVEFGDPETWKEKVPQFMDRPVHNRPIEKPVSSTYGKYVNQIAGTRLQPEEPLSKYKSYSELELLGNISAKKPNYEIEEEYMYDVMPMYNPKDIVPKGSRPVMPNEYNREPSDGILELARGGRVKPKK